MIPSFAHGVHVAFAIRIGRLWRGRMVWFAAFVCVAIAAVGILVGHTSETEPADVFLKMVEGPIRRALVVLLPLLACGTAVAEEVERRTIVYLHARPVGRGALLLGKLLAGAAFSLALSGGTVILLHVGLQASDPSEIVSEAGPLGRALAMVALASLYYAAMATLFDAALVEVPYLLALLYFAFFDLLFGWLPGPFRLASIGHHLANLLGRAEIRGFGIETPHVGALVSVGVIAAVTAVFIALGVLVYRSSQYAYGR